MLSLRPRSRRRGKERPAAARKGAEERSRGHSGVEFSPGGPDRLHFLDSDSPPALRRQRRCPHGFNRFISLFINNLIFLLSLFYSVPCSIGQSGNRAGDLLQRPGSRDDSGRERTPGCDWWIVKNLPGSCSFSCCDEICSSGKFVKDRP